jgi:hypothetical protein
MVRGDADCFCHNAGIGIVLKALQVQKNDKAQKVCGSQALSFAMAEKSQEKYHSYQSEFHYKE